MGPAFGDAGHHRQDRLLAIERLYLALLVDAEHQRPIGRRQVKTDNVADLVDEQRIAGKLECLRAMGLQSESGPDPSDRRVRKAGLAAIERIDQCVASFGVERRVRSITAAT